MRFDRSLLWHEGLFLQPHHFQIQDLYHQGQGWLIRRTVQPWPWGILAIEIRQEALANGIFQLDSAEVIFPEGTWVKWPGNAQIKSRSVKDAAPDDGSSFPVYLGLRYLSDDRPNVSATSLAGALNGALPVGGDTRFVVHDVPETIPDIYAHQTEAQVRFVDYNLRLFVGEAEASEQGDYSLIQLSELESEGDGFRISPRFIPPLLWAGAWPALWSMVEEVKDRLTAKGQDLWRYKASRLGKTSAPGGQDIMLIQALQCLNRHIPVWHHLAESTSVHPQEVYGLLRGVVGELSTFVPEADALGTTSTEPPLPTYCHTALGQCFHTALARFVSFLGELGAGPDYVIDLLFDGTYYSADLLPVLFEGKVHFYLVLESEVGNMELQRLMATTAKLASREHMPLLIARALSGLKFHPLTDIPPALPRKAGAAYFELDTHDREPWAKIQEGHNLVLYFDSPLADLKVQLMVVCEERR